jgi:hypothetical protein
MNSWRTIWLGTFVVLLAATGCSTGGGFNPNNVTVTVSPATSTITENGQVTLTATVNGLCSTCAPSIGLWYVTENNPANGGICDWFTTPPSAPCPAGTIQQMTGGLSSTLTVTYDAPSTPGTYHIVAEWALLTGPTQTGTAVVTVSP